eukprot:scaffold34673_cov23-Tisochrysis_lutea.AAC.3
MGHEGALAPGGPHWRRADPDRAHIAEQRAVPDIEMGAAAWGAAASAGVGVMERPAAARIPTSPWTYGTEDCICSACGVRSIPAVGMLALTRSSSSAAASKPSVSDSERRVPPAPPAEAVTVAPPVHPGISDRPSTTSVDDNDSSISGPSVPSNRPSPSAKSCTSSRRVGIGWADGGSLQPPRRPMPAPQHRSTSCPAPREGCPPPLRVKRPSATHRAMARKAVRKLVRLGCSAPGLSWAGAER